MGELHTAFAALKIIRKYINFRDTHIGLLKAGMYGINAVEENRDGSWGNRSSYDCFPFLYMVVSQFFENNLDLTYIIKQKTDIISVIIITQF